MKVVPHNELRELEHAEYAGVYDLPTGLTYESALQCIEDALHVDAVLVGRDFALELGDQDVKVLLELLEKRDVNDRIIVDLTHDVAADAEFTYQFDRHEDYRSIAVGFLLIVGPLKESLKVQALFLFMNTPFCDRI